MIRSRAWLALVACKVEIAKWPVSAKARACSMVSRSRISPIKITSGAWRRVFLSAAWKFLVSTPISRWFTMLFLCLCTNSMGSSMVMMCPAELMFLWSIKEAKEVDLPEPVPPTNKIKPRFAITTSFSTWGRPRSSNLGISATILRATRATSLRWRNIFKRKRPQPGKLMAMFNSISSANSFFWSLSMTASTIWAIWPGFKGSRPKGFNVPWNLALGGAPVLK